MPTVKRGESGHPRVTRHFLEDVLTLYYRLIHRAGARAGRSLTEKKIGEWAADMISDPTGDRHVTDELYSMTLELIERYENDPEHGDRIRKYHDAAQSLVRE